MKKSISIILAVLMMLSVFSITASAKNGPNSEKDEYELYTAQIYLFNVKEDGGDVGIFIDNEVHNDAIEGASYDLESNTLTLKDFNHPEFTLGLTDMGDDFKLNIEGECVLYGISVSTDDYGGSLTVTGTGLLTVNPDKQDETAVRFLAEGADSTLRVEDTVSVKFLSCVWAVTISGTAHHDKDTVFMQGEKTVKVAGGKQSYEGDVTVDGAYVSRDNGTKVGYRARQFNDRESIYSVTISKDETGQDIYHVEKYIISNQLGVWVKDDSFEAQDLTKEEFDAMYFLETQQGSTPKVIEYTDVDGGKQTGYLVEDTVDGGYFVIDIDYNKDGDDGMMHRAKPLTGSEADGYEVAATWNGYETDHDSFFSRGLRYVYNDEYIDFEEPNIVTDEFEVYVDDEGNRYVIDDEDNIYRVDDETVTIDDDEYNVLIPWQGLTKDNLTPLTEEQEGDYYEYEYEDEDYIYMAPKPATPDEPETTEPETTEPETTEPVETTTPQPTSEPVETTIPREDPTNVQPTNAEPATRTPEANTKATEATEPTVKEVKKGSSEKQVDKFVTKLKTEKDPKGSVFGLLCARQKKAAKKSVTVKWNKLKNAKSYIVYGSKCGTKKGQIPPYKKITKTTKSSYTRKGLKKGVYFKFLIVALDKKNKVLASSKTVHIATKGGKVGNDKTVKVNKTKVTINMKKSKTYKIKAKEVAQSKKLTVKRHRPIKYESSNKKVAKVNSKGKVTAKKKGTAYIYVYAQNGFYKKVKVTVKK